MLKTTGSLLFPEQSTLEKSSQSLDVAISISYIFIILTALKARFHSNFYGSTNLLASFSVGLASLARLSSLHLSQLQLHLSSDNLEIQNSCIWIASVWSCVFTLKITQKCLRSRSLSYEKRRRRGPGQGPAMVCLCGAPAPQNEERRRTGTQAAEKPGVGPALFPAADPFSGSSNKQSKAA